MKQIEYTISVGTGTTVSSEPYDDAIINFNFGVDFKKDILSSSNAKSKVYGLIGAHLTQRGGQMGNTLDEWLEAGNSYRITQINVPLHVGYKRVFKNNWRVFIDVGPYNGFNSNCHFSDGFGQNDYILESKKLDFGLGGNFGICFKKFGFGFGIDKGLMNIARFSSEEMGISNEMWSAVSYIRLQWTFNKQ